MRKTPHARYPAAGNTASATARTWLALAAALLLLLCAAGPALADSHSLATLGLSSRVAYQTPGQTSASGHDYSLHAGLRTEFFYLFGAEMEYTPVPDRLASDIYRPSMRLTGHIHLLNLSVFDLYLGAGMAGDRFGDIVSPNGRSTLYRFGGGFEIIWGGHWALGMDGYWMLPGVGFYNERLKASLDAGESLPDPREQIQTDAIELGFALRYYL